MTAKTLLNAVNEVLKRSAIIAGDSGVLTTLTDSARQPSIDMAVQVINEGVDELYSTTGKPLSSQLKAGTITLATGTRAYALATDLAQLRWPFIDRTNGQFLEEAPGGYEELLLADIEQDDTGLPHFAAIRETDGYLHLDRAPSSVENGRVYTYQYDKQLGMSAAADSVPFNDDVFRAMVPAWVQLFKRERRNEFDQPLYKMAMGRAARLMTMAQPRDSYLPR